MEFAWVQDRSGRNVIHLPGCRHTRMDHSADIVQADDLAAAMVVIAADNCDPDITTADAAAEWVSVARCAR